MNESGKGGSGWLITKEKIFITIALCIVVYEAITAVVAPAAFHYEFLVLAAALFGVSIAGWGDRR